MMKKTKIVLLFVVAIAMLAFSACGGGTTTPTPTPTPEPTPDPGYELPITLPEEIDPDEEFGDYDIFVNGVGLPGVHPLTLEDEIFPSHVPLVPVAEALGAFVATARDEVLLEGIIGPIFFTVGSEDFLVDGQTVTLFHPSIEEDGVIYVPILFFRDVFGVGTAFFEGNQAIIADEESDMQ